MWTQNYLSSKYRSVLLTRDLEDIQWMQERWGAYPPARVYDSESTISAQLTLEWVWEFLTPLAADVFGTGTFHWQRRDNAVGIATRYGQDGPRIESGGGRDFPHPSRPALGLTQSPVQWVPGHFSGGKAAGAWPWHPPHVEPTLKKE
jgi:hypothetical protein